MKMAQLINFEVDVDNEESENCKEVSDDSDLDSLKSFIVDNEEINDNDVNLYRTFNNVETDIEQTLEEEYQKGLKIVENFDEISNLCERSEEELEIDDFKNAREKIENFNETLIFPKTNIENIENNRLITVLLLATRFDNVGKTNVCTFGEFKESIDSNLIQLLEDGNLIYKNSIVHVTSFVKRQLLFENF